MKSTKLSQILSQELGIHITPTRIARYEERGTVPSPKRLGKAKEYTSADYDRLKTVIVLSEMGVGLDEARRYILGQNQAELVESFKDRIEVLTKILSVARTLWN